MGLPQVSHDVDIVEEELQIYLKEGEINFRKRILWLGGKRMSQCIH